MSIFATCGRPLSRALTGAALAWTACFAALPAYSATATLTNSLTNSCTYTSTSSDAAGNITVVCTSTTSPGQIAFAQSTSSANINNPAATLQVNRNGGTTGLVGATVSASGGCSVNGGASTTVSYADTSATPVVLTVGTPVTPTTCIFALSSATGGATLGGNATVNVIDPTLPGVFSFASASSNSTTGVTNHVVTVQRTGGSNGAYDVAYTAAPATLTGYSATPASPIRFNDGVNSASITVDSGSTAGSVLYTLTTATPVAPTTAPTTASGTHNVTVTLPSNCPVPGSNVTVLTVTPATNTGKLYSGPTAVGSIISIPVPSSTTRLRTFNSSQTPSNFNVTFAIAQCPGVVQSTWLTSGPVPCRKQAGYTGNALDIVNAPTFAKCHWTPAERAAGGYYMNIRIDNCDSGNCSFMYQMDY